MAVDVPFVLMLDRWSKRHDLGYHVFYDIDSDNYRVRIVMGEVITFDKSELHNFSQFKTAFELTMGEKYE